MLMQQFPHRQSCPEATSLTRWPSQRMGDSTAPFVILHKRVIACEGSGRRGLRGVFGPAARPLVGDTPCGTLYGSFLLSTPIVENLHPQHHVLWDTGMSLWMGIILEWKACVSSLPPDVLHLPCVTLMRASGFHTLVGALSCAMPESGVSLCGTDLYCMSGTALSKELHQ